MSKIEKLNKLHAYYEKLFFIVIGFFAATVGWVFSTYANTPALLIGLAIIAIIMELVSLVLLHRIIMSTLSEIEHE